MIEHTKTKTLHFLLFTVLNQTLQLISLPFLPFLCSDPDDDEIVMKLVQALVGSVGHSVLDPGVTGSFHLLKAVVARVYVEIYMQLDGIAPENVSRVCWS